MYHSRLLSLTLSSVLVAAAGTAFAGETGGSGFVDPAYTTISSMRLVSKSGSVEGNADSGAPVLFAAGAKILFRTAASNLPCRVVIETLATGALTCPLAGLTSAGKEPSVGSLAIAPDGSRLAFDTRDTLTGVSASPGISNVYSLDLKTRKITLVSADKNGFPIGGGSQSPVFSPDGHSVAFESPWNLGFGQPMPLQSEIYVRNLTTGRLVPVSTNPAGKFANDGTYGSSATGAPTISPDGTKVAFESDASNLTTTCANAKSQVFLKDLTTGAVKCLSLSLGRTAGNGRSGTPKFSPDGKSVAFASSATNLVVGDTNGSQDVFVRDLVKGATRRVSTGANGKQANGSTNDDFAFSPDGGSIAFSSWATNLVAGQTNDACDLFLKNLSTGSVFRLSKALSGAQSSRWSTSGHPAFSPDGKKVAFDSFATNLVAGDTNAAEDVFVAGLK